MEPAVKPATERTSTGLVGVIATEATFQGDLLAALVGRYGRDVRVIPQVCPGLVDAVEAGAVQDCATHGLLHTALAPLLDAGVDQFVLGCTHYSFLKPAIQRIVGPNVCVIDPVRAVARQAVRILCGMDSRECGQRVCAGGHTFYATGDPLAFTSAAARLLNPSDDTLRAESLRWREGKLDAGSG